MPTHFAGRLVLIFGMIALCIFSTWDAAYGPEEQSSKPSQWWLAILLSLALVSAVFHSNWPMRAAGFQAFVVPSRSMENTVQMNARVMVDLRYYSRHTPSHGDIVIFRNLQGTYVMKRVIACGGETIEGHQGVVLIDGQQISEPYAVHSGVVHNEFDDFGPLKVPEGKLFVMGDNRDVSLDSRAPSVGPISIASLSGRALYSFIPFESTLPKSLQ